MYRSFFSIPEDAFILCIGFFYRFRKMLLEAEIIDSVFYVCHRDYIYIYRISYNHVQHIVIKCDNLSNTVSTILSKLRYLQYKELVYICLHRMLVWKAHRTGVKATTATAATATSLSSERSNA